jgi:hypothetical protein
MASLSLPIPLERRTMPATGKVLLVAGLGNPVALDYAAYVGRRFDGKVIVVGETEVGDDPEVPVPALVVFVEPRLSERARTDLEAIVRLASRCRPQCICVVGGFRVHLDDPGAAADEAWVLGRFQGLGERLVLIRAGHVLSPHSRAAIWLRRLGCCAPLLPQWVHTCAVAGDDLFAAIESERQSPRRGNRVLTLLGPNRPCRDWLTQQRSRHPGSWFLSLCCAALALLGIGQLAGLVLDFLARRRPGWRSWNLDTLQPSSLAELLSLVNPHNYRHVKVVGYNNGVNHFGQQFPGKTVVSTVRCHRIVRVADDCLKVDCGATIRRVRDVLGPAGQDLYVMPNFSYVSMGTAFYVPIHGSAVDYSTVADTITRVVLYDPTQDRILAADRNEPVFRDNVFNLQSPAIVLRLYIRVKSKSPYYVQRQQWDNPSSADLLNALSDRQAANVEMRLGRASSDTVQVSRYYTTPGAAPSPVLELPRDSLGRLWDRLEENPLTSFVLHAMTRYFAWHVELFFTAEEFATFWTTRKAIPLRKIQLRYLRRDGMPHSPFRDHDCVSSDMFMLRRHRRRFEAYLKNNFAVVRANPGKHSQ